MVRTLECLGLFILNVSWKDHPSNHEVYGNMPKITEVIRERRVRLAGHSFRNKNELASDLLLWAPEHGQRRRGRPYKSYIDQLIVDCGHTLEELPQAQEI